MTQLPSLDLAAAPRHTVSLAAGPIAYREIGAGPPLVFVHGLLVNSQLWRKVVPHLAGGFRCILPDWPLGSHRTPMTAGADLTPPGLARIIVDFLDALSLPSATLVANDTGGALAQVVSATWPQRVDRLVLTACDMFDNFLPPMFKPLQVIGGNRAGLHAVMQMMRLQAVRNSPLGYGWLAKRRIEASVTDEYLQGVLTSAEIRRDVSKVLRGISPRYTQEAAEVLRGFDRPVLLAWCDDSRVFPVAHAHRMGDLLPRARVEVIADSYAFVPEDQPDHLGRLIAEFAS